MSHHWAVNGADAVVAHVQRGQVSPHRNDSSDRTARLYALRFPLGELAGLRDQDRLEDKAHVDHTKYSLNVNTRRHKIHHHSFRGAVDTHSSQAWPQRRQTLNLLRAALANLKTHKKTRDVFLQAKREACAQRQMFWGRRHLPLFVAGTWKQTGQREDYTPGCYWFPLSLWTQRSDHRNKTSEETITTLVEREVETVKENRRWIR